MAYWLISVSEDNFLTCIKVGIFGGTNSKQKAFSKMEKGDRLVFYVSHKYVHTQIPKISEFRGVGTTTGHSFWDTEKIWESPSHEVYPIRIPFRMDISKKAVPVRDLLDDLDFVTAKNTWWLAFFNTPREISKKDFEKIEKSLKITS